MKFLEKIRSYTGEEEIVNVSARRGGGYALTLSLLVLLILVVINVAVNLLPANITRLDISSSRLYSITSNTKVVVNALEKDVTIYWIVQSDKEDRVIENLLSKYDSLSEHIEIVKKNPDVYPTFTENYTKESVPNNSLIVECDDKYRYISYNDIYIAEGTSRYNQEYSFDGEGALTSAIDYVVSEQLPIMYVLKGHGERDLSNSFSKQLTKENIETRELSLLTADEIPEDASFVLVYAPDSDISEQEKDMLIEYISKGGRLLVYAGPLEADNLDNLYGVLSHYGVEREEGIVVETDRGHYAFGMPYILLSDIESSEVTDPLIEENYYCIVPVASGLKIRSSSYEVTELLKTSNTSFSKADGYSLTTYEKEDSDIDGPFTLGVMIENDSGGKLIWYTSSDMLEDLYNSYSSGANVDLAINSISSLVGERESIAIRSKSLNNSYLTISDSDASKIKILMIGIIPFAFIVTGIYTVIKRRRKYNG
ncbi:MAG: Gldg family protein [Erysipelotrichaceae bacterium]